MFKLALSGTNPKFYEKYDLKGICGFIKSIGLDALEVVDANLEPLKGTERVMGVWSNLDIAGAKKILDEMGVMTPVVQFRYAFNKEISADAERHVKEFKASIDAAVQLGAKKVLHYLCFEVFKTQDMQLIHAYCDEPLRYAQSKGIYLVMENEFENAANQTPEKMLAIMEEFNNPYFLTNYDAPNYEMAGCEGYPYAYNMLKDYIGYVHLKNVCVYKPKFCDSRYEIGHTISGGMYEGLPIAFVSAFEGSVNIPALLKRLKDDNYDFYLTFEPHAELELAMEDIKKDMVVLKKLGYAK